jgi:AraC-like DNA-binding protein
MPLLFSQAAWSLVERRGKARLGLKTKLEAPAAVQFAAEFGFAWAASLGRQLVGQDTAPLRVCLPYAPPAHADAYERVLRCPVYFDCEEAEIVFDAAALDVLQPCHNEHMYRVLREQAERALEALNSPEPWHHRVLETLIDDEHALVDDWSYLAAKLSISTRTLRRHIAKEGFSLSELRDEARKRHALQLLTETDRPVKQISERVGFSEVSPFYRAFRRWTGHTPIRYRFEHRDKGRSRSDA